MWVALLNRSPTCLCHLLSWETCLDCIVEPFHKELAWYVGVATTRVAISKNVENWATKWRCKSCIIFIGSYVSCNIIISVSGNTRVATMMIMIGVATTTLYIQSCSGYRRLQQLRTISRVVAALGSCNAWNGVATLAHERNVNWVLGIMLVFCLHVGFHTHNISNMWIKVLEV